MDLPEISNSSLLLTTLYFAQDIMTIFALVLSFLACLYVGIRWLSKKEIKMKAFANYWVWGLLAWIIGVASLLLPLIIGSEETSGASGSSLLFGFSTITIVAMLFVAGVLLIGSLGVVAVKKQAV